MKRLAVFFVFVVVLDLSACAPQFSHCARMDSKIPGLGKASRTQCNYACKLKKCKLGECMKVREKVKGMIMEKVRCECFSCGKGRNFPLEILDKLAGGMLPKKRRDRTTVAPLE
ncbi:hypothetical protein ANCCAN_01683 [Ancylostoma caninum]|uniref:Uncharacterized protein n=1 Tax=Ancylostoma caninum TaxID=29170 RepID=A0A368HA66_ANCCA|nr:hypothetical protein ANCCAN_01683 [Ancylostoma caninum]